MAFRELALEVDHDPQGVFAFHVTDTQLRIVSRHRAPAHDHGIAKRAQPVKVDEALKPGDIMRSPGFGCDISVEALPQLRDHERRFLGPCQGAVEAQQFLSERIGCLIRQLPGEQLVPYFARALGQIGGKEIAH